VGLAYYRFCRKQEVSPRRVHGLVSPLSALPGALLTAVYVPCGRLGRLPHRRDGL